VLSLVHQVAPSTMTGAPIADRKPASLAISAIAGTDRRISRGACGLRSWSVSCGF
jgi:hypothetical protein